MKPCPHCQYPIEDSARFCVHCTTSLDEKRIWIPPRRHRPHLRKTVALACVIALAVSAVWLWPQQTMPPSDGVTSSVPVAGTTDSAETTAASTTTAAPAADESGTTTAASSTTTSTTRVGFFPFLQTLFSTTTTRMPTTTTTAPKIADKTASTSSTTTSTTEKMTTTSAFTPPTVESFPVTDGAPKDGTKYFVTPYYADCDCGELFHDCSADPIYTANPYYERSAAYYMEIYSYQFSTYNYDYDEPYDPPVVSFAWEARITYNYLDPDQVDEQINAERIRFHFRFALLDKTTGEVAYVTPLYSSSLRIGTARGWAYNLPIDDPDDYYWRFEGSIVAEP